MMLRRALLLIAVAGTAGGCSELLTEAPAGGDLFDSPLPGLPPELLHQFFEGDENFGIVFTKEQGLGPIFVRASCSHRHIADGRGTPEQLVTRFSRGTDLALSIGGARRRPT